MFLKDVVENKGGYRFFYVDGQPFRRKAICTYSTD